MRRWVRDRSVLSVVDNAAGYRSGKPHLDAHVLQAIALRQRDGLSGDSRNSLAVLSRQVIREMHGDKVILGSRTDVANRKPSIASCCCLVREDAAVACRLFDIDRNNAGLHGGTAIHNSRRDPGQFDGGARDRRAGPCSDNDSFNRSESVSIPLRLRGKHENCKQQDSEDFHSGFRKQRVRQLDALPPASVGDRLTMSQFR